MYKSRRNFLQGGTWCGWCLAFYVINQYRGIHGLKILWAVVQGRVNSFLGGNYEYWLIISILIVKTFFVGLK